jgi:pyruvate kinase
MQELRMSPGDKVVFWDPECSSDGLKQIGALSVPLPGVGDLVRKLAPQHHMWFCDGRINFVVDEVHGSTVLVRLVEATVPLKSSNSLFLPDSPSPFTAITKEDRHLMQSFADNNLLPDWVALSLISSPEDVRTGRQEVREHLGDSVRIMAKFETVTAVECAEDIIRAADGIMVARGDLGLAVGYLRLPEVQEQLVAAARRAGKPVVVATQVMEGFAEAGIPQRAELSDLSLIARQRADAVMLGKETVFSKRPIGCIRFAKEMLAHETRRFEKGSKLASMESLGTKGLTA